MPPIQHEVECKYQPPDDAELPDLTGLEGVAGVSGPETHRLQATYFDTAGLALSAAGLTLRRRTGGGDAGWHLKVPAPDGARDELREPLGGGAPLDVPGPLADAVQLHARGQDLAAVAQVSTRRRLYRLVDDEGRTLAEVCDDEVSSRTPTVDPGENWREWEVELVDGDESLLAAADEALRASGAGDTPSRSKLARVLGGRMSASSEHGGEDPPGPGSTAAEVVHARLRAQLAELRYRDPLVRYDVTDSVHKMRVAMRRLGSALASYRPLLDRERTEPVREELKWIARILGEARDAEVLHERLARLVGEEPTELVMGPVARRVDSALAGDYRLAHKRAVEAMRSPRYYALIDDLDALVAEPPWSDGADRPAVDVLPARVAKELKRVRRRVSAADDAPDRAARDERLHEVRKAAKRARYAAEPLVPVVGRDAKRFVKATKRVQRVLGDHHDAVVTRPVLREIAVQAHLHGENAFAFGRLHAREQAEAARLEEEYDDAWSRANAKKRRRWLD